MEQISDIESLKVVPQIKSKESHAEPERSDSKIQHEKKLLVADASIISNLGWISILSMTIASMTVGCIGDIL